MLCSTYGPQLQRPESRLVMVTLPPYSPKDIISGSTITSLATGMRSSSGGSSPLATSSASMGASLVLPSTLWVQPTRTVNISNDTSTNDPNLLRFFHFSIIHPPSSLSWPAERIKHILYNAQHILIVGHIVS